MDDEYEELGRAAYAGNGCIYCFSTTHLAGPNGCPRDIEPYCVYGHYEEHQWLPECINEMSARGDPRLEGR